MNSTPLEIVDLVTSREDIELLQYSMIYLSFHSTFTAEVAGFSSLGHQPIVGVLYQPCSSGNR